MIPFYCRRCQELLGPEDADCPFCGDAATPIDELADEAVRELSHIGAHDHACAVALLRERAFAPARSTMPNLRTAEE